MGLVNVLYTSKGSSDSTSSDNPVFTGSLSINRKAGSEIGTMSVAEGYNTTASGNFSHAEGHRTIASGYDSHAEGGDAEAVGTGSHAEGFHTRASGDYSHAEGKETVTYGMYSHAEGYSDSTLVTAYGYGSHAEGFGTTAGINNSSRASHAEGDHTRATGNGSHAEGDRTYASGSFSHAEGSLTRATSPNSHAEGNNTTASGDDSHAGGKNCTAITPYSFVHGDGLRTPDSSYWAGAVFGKYNNINTMKDSTFTIGGGYGSDSSSQNIFRVDMSGNTYARAYNSGGADFAEIYEWEDGNTEEEDRRGLFVTNNIEKIVIAQPADYILGAISSNPCIVGNNPEDWDNRWIRDLFGNIVTEEVDVMDIIDKEIKHEDTIVLESVIDEKGKETIVEKVIPGEVEIIKEYGPTGEKRVETRNKQNPDYDQDKTYTTRSNRKEWAYVGLHGQIVMIDDGTCEVNGFCKPSVGGIATKANTHNGYRVLNRLDDTHIKIQMESIKIFD